MGSPHRLSPALLVAMACSLFSSVVSAAPTPYYAVIDAGSGGSRLYLYQVDSSVPTAPIVNQLTLSGVYKVKPGISTDLNNCDSYISPLFNTLSNNLIAQNIAPASVTVSLQATAGMRVISPVDQTKCYGAVQTELNKQLPNVVVGPIKTIQGRYEGAFQWMTVNYLKGNLNSGQNTVGVLEVGGGSYQMTFESPGKLQTLDFISIPFGGKSYSLFSRSYTGLGGNFSREDATDDPNAFQVGFQLASGAVGTGDYYTGKLSARKIIRAKPVNIPPQAKMPPLSSFVGVGLYEQVAVDFKLGTEISSASIDQAASVFARQPYDVNTTNSYEFSKVYTAQLISEMIRTWFPPKQNLKVEDTIGGKAVTWTLGSAAYMAGGGIIP